ncbi:hypothetical protein HMPREF9104_00950 [Lentilactobacillus kisonensis F0435]|uniref:DUF3899 domain-containing protein n=1 Tax=Lentilactobacillus kisonensis F0435 TaxID=797516 RepID=H1LEC4_9LACO|nr:hypothetical protein HMPREF9104_00950 [Lentilactobacillus kisonensis F0435]
MNREGPNQFQHRLLYVLIFLFIIIAIGSMILVQDRIWPVSLGVGAQLFSLSILLWYLYGLMIYNVYHRQDLDTGNGNFWVSTPSGRRINPYTKSGLITITVVNVFCTTAFIIIFLLLIW